jgi:asparagine synthase (glutamine-hydrolysing)
LTPTQFVIGYYFDNYFRNLTTEGRKKNDPIPQNFYIQSIQKPEFTVCGITGILNLDDKPVLSDIIGCMLSQIAYRGPDDRGIYINGGTGFGNVRLSIIDLSTGQQPMCNDDKSLWIVYNGEVFNYIELRAALKKHGVQFKTDSDTEVVLKYYEKYGEKCLDFFNGQFAIAIWDNNKQELFLARDRVGIRPLFYFYQNNTFIFGSEIKCILSHPDVKAELDIQILSEVFTFWTSLTPNTCFKNIVELSPGHYIKLSKTKFEVRKYWELSFSNELRFQRNDIATATSELEEILKDAVQLRLRADVPVAAYLSGGLDSAATTYFIKRSAHDRLQTFSIGFSEKEYDESQYQQEVSSYLNTNHTSFTCTNEEIAENFKKVIWHTEFPLLRTAPVPMYLLSKHVRENNIKVVITGEGADEMLGGYNIFKEMLIRRFWARYPDSKIRPLLLKKLYPYISSLQQQDVNKLKFFFGYKLNETNSPYYSHLLRWNNTSKILSYLNPDQKELTINSGWLSKVDTLLPIEFDIWEPLAQAQWLETEIFMSGYLLSSQGDRMAMANSVEGRYPFLDYRVIEFCSRLHADLKLRGLNEKYILKKAMAGKLPGSILSRSKQAYRAPIRKVFLNDKMPEYFKDYLSQSKIKDIGIFDPVRVHQLFDRMSGGTQSELDDMAITAIISTQILYGSFIKDFPKVKPIKECRILVQE